MTLTQTSLVLQRIFKEERIPEQRIASASRVYAALVDHVAAARRAHQGAFVLGICGSQGSGKSTAARVIGEALQQIHGLSVAVLSLDDLYLSSHERMQLARDVHPLLRTRGVPGTHDVERGMQVIRSLVNAGPADETPMPRFDKAFDEPRPAAECDVFRGRADVVIFEGWCVGAIPQEASELLHPVNELERLDDADGRWRRFVNAQLADRYQALFALLSCLLMIRAPDYECVSSWRMLQERKLSEKLGAMPGVPTTSRVMSDAEIGRFILYYERLTRHTLAEMPARADIVVELDRCHHMISLLLRFDSDDT
jgi:D-glycerate 3-kinase